MNTYYAVTITQMSVTEKVRDIVKMDNNSYLHQALFSNIDSAFDFAENHVASLLPESLGFFEREKMKYSVAYTRESPIGFLRVSYEISEMYISQ
jgi:DNA polymerase III psi subunit